MKADTDKTVRAPDNFNVKKSADFFVKEEYRNDGGYPQSIRDQLLKIIQYKTANSGQNKMNNDCTGVSQAANDLQI